MRRGERIREDEEDTVEKRRVDERRGGKKEEEEYKIERNDANIIQKEIK